MLEFDRYGDAEAFQAGKRVEGLIAPHRPKELEELRFQTGEDHSGDPAIWIWAIITQEPDPLPSFVRTTKTIRALLEAASREAAPELWPYIQFRTVGEVAELAGAVAP